VGELNFSMLKTATATMCTCAYHRIGILQPRLLFVYNLMGGISLSKKFIFALRAAADGTNHDMM